MDVGSSVQETSPSELDFTTVDKAAELEVMDLTDDSISSTENSEAKTEERFNGVGGAGISLAFKEKGQAVEVFPQNIDVVPGPSTGVVKNGTILNYCIFIDILKSLNKSGGATFEDINMYMAEKNIPKSTKQIKYYLYRGVRNRELKKYVRDGKKIYKINEKRHIIGIKNSYTSELDFTTVDKAAELEVIDFIDDNISSTENSEAKTEERFNGVGGVGISLALKEKGQAVEVFPQNIDVVPGPSTGVVKNGTVLNYCIFIDILKSLNKSGGATFEDINMYMDEKNIPKCSKQIKYYLYRGVRNRELKKYVRDGKKIYKINEKRHIIGIKNSSDKVD